MADNKIDQYLIDLMYTYQQVENNLWLIDDEEHNLNGVAVSLTDALVTFRVMIMDAPKENSAELFAKLLELNADLINGAYALSGSKIWLLDTLQYENMDYGDFRAVLDSFSLALELHYPVLSAYRSKSDRCKSENPGKK